MGARSTRARCANGMRTSCASRMIDPKTRRRWARDRSAAEVKSRGTAKSQGRRDAVGTATSPAGRGCRRVSTPMRRVDGAGQHNGCAARDGGEIARSRKDPREGRNQRVRNRDESPVKNDGKPSARSGPKSRVACVVSERSAAGPRRQHERRGRGAQVTQKRRVSHHRDEHARQHTRAGESGAKGGARRANRTGNVVRVTRERPREQRARGVRAVSRRRENGVEREGARTARERSASAERKARGRNANDAGPARVRVSRTAKGRRANDGCSA